jgi:orotidine-5'-phosphate decarboxylase
MGAGRARIFVAIDTTDAWAAATLVRELSGIADGVKLGLEFFSAHGAAGVRAIEGLPLFLDLKFHDIPNTVAGAVRAALPLSPALLTVHAAGGEAMMRAAADAAREGGEARPRLIGVTVLTSLNDADLEEVGQRAPALDQVVRLARLAQYSGLDGVVCSPLEVAAVREVCGPDFLLVVPGIRPKSAAAGDQKRVMTPAEAVAAGADVLVIGRPITGAAEPAKATRAIAEELA